MSWFTDLAGRAEELLNKVDKTAAGVLNKDDEGPQSARNVTRSYDYETNTLDNVSTSKSPPKSNVSYVPRSPIRVNTLKKPANQSPTTSSTSRLKSSTQGNLNVSTTDEKLLEFLNSEEPTKKNKAKTVEMENESKAVTNNVPMVSATLATNSETSGISELESKAVEEPLAAVINEIKDSENSKAENSNTINVRSLQFENQLFHKEIASLNQELNQSVEESKRQRNEIQRLTKELEVQLSGGDKMIRELHNRESDFKQALDAKDSQLAVLRIRLQEADLEVSRLREMSEKVQTENRRILDDQSSSSDLQSQALYTLQQRLQQTEDLAERERINFKSAQNESLQRIEKLESEVSSMASNLNEAENKVLEEKSRNVDLAAQIRSLKQMGDSAEQELANYKLKAQRILQSKEKLISSLKEGNSMSGINIDRLEISAAEFEDLQHERDDLKDEVLQANQQISSLRNEIQEMEVQMQEEVLLLRERNRELDRSLQEEKESRKEREREILQLKEDGQYERESSSRQKATLQSRIQDRDCEIEKLRNQLIAKQVNSTSQAELEARLNTLTESLIQKQTVLEALSTEKSSLVLQLERMEHNSKDQSAYVRRNQTVNVNVSEENDVRLRVADFMVEKPFDGQVTRKVKRVYNSIDTLSFRLGVFLRRYPMARILIIIYMVMLHLWVLIVLLTYTPEAHPIGYNVPDGKSHQR